MSISTTRPGWRRSGCGIDPEDYAGREFSADDVLPWDHIDCGVDKRWLWREWQKAAEAEKTLDCRQGPCSGCGICQSLDCDNYYAAKGEEI